ncbi:hypothetical protein TIFTF001_015228 [Ficus carica]|uniref:Uncharacterized protein n=1 Tax=Ficus carica TaxID=3494 RepID=A0AA88A7G1_FICCA|nr:hypothetical protein TIFTF001_015228 [Ficus carica]
MPDLGLTPPSPWSTIDLLILEVVEEITLVGCELCRVARSVSRFAQEGPSFACGATVRTLQIRRDHRSS